MCHLIQGYVEKRRVEQDNLELVFECDWVLEVKVVEARQLVESLVNVKGSYRVAQLFIEGFGERRAAN